MPIGPTSSYLLVGPMQVLQRTGHCTICTGELRVTCKIKNKHAYNFIFTEKES